MSGILENLGYRITTPTKPFSSSTSFSGVMLSTRKLPYDSAIAIVELPFQKHLKWAKMVQRNFCN